MGRSTVSSRLYLTCLAVIPAVAWVLPILIVRYHLPPGVEPTMYASLIDFGYNTAGRNDDIVIFGDSSALYGVNPRLLGEDLGLKAVNLPNTLGSVTVLGDGNLQHYLAVNRPPRLIIFYFAAWNMDYNGRAHDGFMFEGEEVMLRRSTASQVWGFARRNPQEALLFSGRCYAGLARTLVSSRTRRQRHDEEINREDGHLDDAAAVPSLTSSCQIPGWFLDRNETKTTADLAHRYQTAQTKVLVYVAPVPGCAGSQVVTSRSYAMVDAAPPLRMDAASFKDDESFAHVIPEAVEESTRALERAVAARLK